MWRQGTEGVGGVDMDQGLDRRRNVSGWRHFDFANLADLTNALSFYVQIKVLSLINTTFRLYRYYYTDDECDSTSMMNNLFEGPQQDQQGGSIH